MKILLFSSKFPPSIGGVENVVYNLAKNFKKSKHSVLVISSFNYKKDSSSFFSIHKKEPYEGIFVYRVFISLPRSLFGLLIFPYRFVSSLFFLNSIIKKEKPDIIHFHFPDDSLYYFYLLSLRKNFPKFVLTIHGNELHLFSKNPVYKFFLKKVLSKAEGVVVNSQFMKEELQKKYPKTPESKIQIIPNGINLKDFFVDKPKDYFLFVGRLAPKKGVDILIKAYNKVAKKIKRDLYIIGPEVEQGKPLSYYKKLAKSSKIKFLGKVTGGDLRKYFSQAYFTVFPSRIEPFGIVALESLASGTPFIASDFGGFKEIAKNTQGGLLFKNKDIISLKEVILKADNNPSLRQELSKKGLSNVKKYSWETIAKTYLNLYEKTKAVNS